MKYCGAVLTLIIFQSLVLGQVSQQGTVPTFKSQGREVVVDVVATDGSGKVLSDLRSEDFQVFENGKKQQVASFQVSGTTGNPAASADCGAQACANRVRAEQVPTAVLLDEVNTTSKDQLYAMSQLRSFIRHLSPGQLTVVYVFDGQLHRLAASRTDPAVLAAEVEKLAPTPPRLLSMELDMMNNPGASSRGTSDRVDSLFTQRVDLTLGAIEAVAREIPEELPRKRVVWISGSFPLFVRTNSIMASLKDTMNVLAALRVAVYPISALGDATTSESGRKTPRNDSLEYYPTSSMQILDPSNDRVRDLQESSAALNAGRDTMEYVADLTGGLAFTSRNDLDQAMQSAATDGQLVYTLTYAPTKLKQNGSFRRIQVKSTRAGVHLRFRSGYFDRPISNPTP